MSDPLTAEEKSRLSKLPIWAQQMTTRLARRLERLQEERDALAAGKLGPDGSNTFLEPFDAQPTMLPQDAQVGFRLGLSREDEVHASISGDELEIRARGLIAVSPRAANTITIRRISEW